MESKVNPIGKEHGQKQWYESSDLNIHADKHVVWKDWQPPQSKRAEWKKIDEGNPPDQNTRCGKCTHGQEVEDLKQVNSDENKRVYEEIKCEVCKRDEDVEC